MDRARGPVNVKDPTSTWRTICCFAGADVFERNFDLSGQEGGGSVCAGIAVGRDMEL
jgi:hypothetical protein